MDIDLSSVGTSASAGRPKLLFNITSAARTSAPKDRSAPSNRETSISASFNSGDLEPQRESRYVRLAPGVESELSPEPTR